jgi:hypothetical protein
MSRGRNGNISIVDLLIGTDQAHLIFSMADIRGNAGEPIACLTPIVWTCIGTTSHRSDNEHSNFASFARDSDNSSLDNLIRKYWEFEEPAANTIVKPEGKCAIQFASESVTYQNGRYSLKYRGRQTQRPKQNCQCPNSKVILTGYFCSDFANLEFVRWKSLISGMDKRLFQMG